MTASTSSPTSASFRPAVRRRPVQAVLAAAVQRTAVNETLSVRGLRKSFAIDGGGERALQDVSFSVQAGEFVFICGQTGSGKTTLLRLIHGQLRPDAGDILLGGQNIATLDQRAFRRRVGFAGQNAELLPRLTVEENVAYPLQLLRKPPKEISRRVKEMLEIFDLSHAAGRLADERLSGGERQRLVIARAIAHRPDLLLCDEPTGNLDERTTYGVMHTLNRVSMLGTTVLVVTHDPPIVNLMQKRVIVISDGTVSSDEVGGYRMD